MEIDEGAVSSPGCGCVWESEAMSQDLLVACKLNSEGSQ